MAMDGKELVEKLAKLSQVQSIKDIPQLTHACLLYTSPSPRDTR